jgi:hypothetical protein
MSLLALFNVQRSGHISKAIWTIEKKVQSNKYFKGVWENFKYASAGITNAAKPIPT